MREPIRFTDEFWKEVSMLLRVVFSFTLLYISSISAVQADPQSAMDAQIKTDKLTDQSVDIDTILSSPKSYQLHLVALQGTVRQVRPIGTLFAKCGPVYDSYTFTLEDGTGTIEVTVAGACYSPGVTIPVSEGDRLVVQALIQVVGEEQQIVRAVARWVQRLGQ